MADRPTIFSGPMVKALVAGRKTQTRRVLKPQPYDIPHPSDGNRCWNANGIPGGGRICICDRDLLDLHRAPKSGDRLWVREAWAEVPTTAYHASTGVEQTINPADADFAAVYRAGWERSAPPWRSPIHMPRWASRLTLVVTDVRVQRVQDIGEEDARAEGVCLMEWERRDGSGEGPDDHVEAFSWLWDSINARRGYGWEANPWVAALTFTVRQRNIDDMARLDTVREG